MPRMERRSAVAVPVVGMHRSGTSMVARMLEAGGVSFGPSTDLAGPNDDNPYGFWEHEGIRRVNEELLAKLGGDWRNPPLISAAALQAAVSEDLEQRATSLLDAVAAGSPAYGWKDPRTSLLLPFWLQHVGDQVKAICCLRHPSAVAASLAKRNQLPAGLSSFLWQEYTAAAHQALAQADVLVVAYESILADPLAQAQRMRAHLEGVVDLDTEAMVAAVDASLMHHPAGTQSFDAWWPGGADLLEDLSACADGTRPWSEVQAMAPPREPAFVALMAHAAGLAEHLDFRESAYGDRIRETEEARRDLIAAKEQHAALLAEAEACLQGVRAELEASRTRNDNLQGRIEVRLGQKLRRLFRSSTDGPSA